VPAGARILHPDDSGSSPVLEGDAAQFSGPSQGATSVIDRPTVSPIGGFIPGMITGPEHAVLLRAVNDFCGDESSDDVAYGAPACPYNPLVLYGPPGVGKSTIARGVVQRMVERLARQMPDAEPSRQIVQLCGAEFARQYAAAVTARRVPAWRNSVRQAALLVLEDIAPLAEKIAAQSELIHTIDAIVGAGGQILVTSRLPLAGIPKLLPGLASRLAGGLCLAVPLPEAATRAALLLDFAAARGLQLQPGAARMLAEKQPLTAPELSGALNELVASLAEAKAAKRSVRGMSHLGKRAEIDVATVRAHLKSRPERNRVTLSDVARKAARYYGLKVADLRGASRRQSVVTARNLAMHVARQLTSESLSSVGAYFGGRDHTTVMHGVQRAQELVASDPQVRQAVSQVRADLGV
jgi:chromosomal replication initiator protein